MSLELRPYQENALQTLRDNILEGCRRQVLQLPTGGGKTGVAAALAKLANKRNRRVYFLADRIELIDQASMRFDAEGIEHGIIQGRHPRWHPERLLQVATIQTLQNRSGLPAADLIIVDECHAGGNRLNNWIVKQDAVVIGLSATPWTAGLGKIYQKLVCGVTTSELISLGFLVDIVAWAPSTPDLTGIAVVAGEWEETALAAACDQSKIIGDIVTTWITKGENRQTIVFAVNVAHSQHIVEQFRSAGIDAAHVDGYENQTARKVTVDAFRAGHLKIISNVGILDKGFDAPQASCLILARPVRSSLMLHIQQLGRGLRSFPGKENCIVLDHAGNLERHGFPTDPLPDELDDGKRKPKKLQEQAAERRPNKCQKCFFVKPAGVHACPKCGFASAPRNEIFTEAGELRQIKKTEDKRQLFAEIRYMQDKLGRSDGWASHTFRKMTGVWPNHYKDVKPAEASEYVRNSIKRFDIAFSKNRNQSNGVKQLAADLAASTKGWKEDALHA